MKIRDIVEERINWNALRQAKAVMPYLYDSPEARKEGIKPNPREPNIITSINLKEPKRPGETFTPLYTMGKAAWQKYMDDWWRDNKNDPRAKVKVAQIKQAAADAKMPIQEFIIMPQTIKPLGLIHLPGKGPNNRFDFKNKNNNRANERVKGIEVMKHTARPMGLEKKNGHYGPIDKNKTNEDEHSVDLKLPTGKKMILQAEDEEHTRGLVVTSNEDGSYDTYYWYENPEEPMAIEVKIDGETVSKDAKMCVGSIILNWMKQEALVGMDISKKDTRKKETEWSQTASKKKPREWG